MNSIGSLLKLIENDSSIKPIIVENCGPRKTYLDELNCDVVYTSNNSLEFHHKGVNELLDIKEVIKQYHIGDEDFVVKITGRYRLLDLSFIDLIKKNMHSHDAFVKFFNVCTLQYGYNDSVLGLIAIKCKYLKDFNYECIYSPETEFAEYVRKNTASERIMEVQTLNLECCFADDLRILYV